MNAVSTMEYWLNKAKNKIRQESVFHNISGLIQDLEVGNHVCDPDLRAEAFRDAYWKWVKPIFIRNMDTYFQKNEQEMCPNVLEVQCT